MTSKFTLKPKQASKIQSTSQKVIEMKAETWEEPSDEDCTEDFIDQSQFKKKSYKCQKVKDRDFMFTNAMIADVHARCETPP